MDDMMSRLGAVLSDEESMKQLGELAEMLRKGSLGGDPGEQSSCDAENSPEKEERAEGGFDPEMMMKLMSAMSALNGSDRNTELLLALRPHLRAEKQLRLDRAVKLLRIFSVLEAANLFNT